MNKFILQTTTTNANQGTFGRSTARRSLASRPSPAIAFLISLSIAAFSPLASHAHSQEVKAPAGASKKAQEDQPKGKVIGLKYNCVHVLDLKKTLKLYTEILGFKKVGEEILRGKGVEGMVVMKFSANGHQINLSLPAPKYADTVGPIGNTNHNHFMLLVDNIVPICDQLKQEGYKLENEAYARDKYSFFTGPNGEIVGLTEYK